MRLARLAVSLVLLVLAGAAIACKSTGAVAALGAAGLVFHVLASGGLLRSVRSLLPVLLFVLVLVLMQWIAGTLTPELPLKTAAVFLLATSAVRLLGWTEILESVQPVSPLFTAVLFLLFVRHFVAILGQEARRLLIARGLAVPRRYGTGWFNSLKWAIVGLFRRSLARAERFYAAQALRGLGR